MYRYVLEVELMFIMRYKFELFSCEKYITIRDLQFYLKALTGKVEEENEKIQSGNKFVSLLTALRDILNFMSLPEH